MMNHALISTRHTLPSPSPHGQPKISLIRIDEMRSATCTCSTPGQPTQSACQWGNRCIITVKLPPRLVATKVASQGLAKPTQCVGSGIMARLVWADDKPLVSKYIIACLNRAESH